MDHFVCESSGALAFSWTQLPYNHHRYLSSQAIKKRPIWGNNSVLKLASGWKPNYTQYPPLDCLPWETVSVVILVAEPCGRQGVAEGGMREWVGRRRKETRGWKLNKIKAARNLFHVVSTQSNCILGQTILQSKRWKDVENKSYIAFLSPDYLVAFTTISIARKHTFCKWH